MFTKNDNRSGRYFNGKIGVVTHFEEEGIRVQCADEDFTIYVTTATWENFKYQINPETKQVEEILLGSFEQYPLRLAWAVTIHKSQGLTFDKVIVDAGRSFQPGAGLCGAKPLHHFAGHDFTQPDSAFGYFFRQTHSAIR